MKTTVKNDITARNLIMHYKSYPHLQLQDVFKFIHQSSFGCEHAVEFTDAAIKGIYDEYKKIPCGSQPIVEELDGEYCRVHLSWLNRGLSAETLGKMFVSSAKNEPDGMQNLICKLKTARELVCKNLLPFSESEFDKALEEWKKNGYEPLHHSEIFRNEYKPSYRVTAKRYAPFFPLFSKIDSLLEKGSVKLAVEGGSASGKTTLGNMLSEIYECNVFHTDDFFLQKWQRTSERYNEAGGNFDRERFLSEVLVPAHKGEAVAYRKFDCSEMKLKQSVIIFPKKLTVTEGAYSMHPELAPYYDFSVFLDVSPQLQKERILTRNTALQAESFFNKWIPLEKKYFSEMNIREKCDMVISVT